MSDHSDFFGDVFDDPSEDPLLGNEDGPADETAERSDPHGRPSWMSDGEGSSEQAASSEADCNRAGRKKIVVDQRREEADGIDALNRAVGEGWRLVRLSLDRPDGEQAVSREAAQRFVAILEQEQPRSLFDFGAAS
jgi:hypothetical protein